MTCSTVRLLRSTLKISDLKFIMNLETRCHQRGGYKVPKRKMVRPRTNKVLFTHAIIRGLTEPGPYDTIHSRYGFGSWNDSLFASLNNKTAHSDVCSSEVNPTDYSLWLASCCVALVLGYVFCKHSPKCHSTRSTSKSTPWRTKPHVTKSGRGSFQLQAR